MQTKVPDRVRPRVLQLGLKQADVGSVFGPGEQGNGVVVRAVLGAVLVRQVAAEAARLVPQKGPRGDEAVGAGRAAKRRGRVGDVENHVGVGAVLDAAAPSAGCEGHETGWDGTGGVVELEDAVAALRVLAAVKTAGGGEEIFVLVTILISVFSLSLSLCVCVLGNEVKLTKESFSGHGQPFPSSSTGGILHSHTRPAARSQRCG